ncbi:hypothetical protein [Candidatus Frankia alpina]|uniref:hypothetical protein n=1 Tax=Candidatus Frankia alpina TaxID=2699483 RepID=UPI0013D77EAA|nr:hypothetical protein [Candidatus Frankia alpina]
MSSGRAAQIDDQTTRVGLTSASQTTHGGGGWHLLRVATARWNDTPPGAGGGPAGDERPWGTSVGRGHGGRRAEGDR